MQRGYRYLDLITVAFVTVLLCTNLIGTAKVAQLWGVTFGSSVVFFPISYVFGDILTEVYGYRASRRTIWAGFGAMIFASLVSFVVVEMPPADPEQQRIVARVFGQTWRIVAASLFAYFVGEFVNSFVLARMKVLTQGKHLWARTIGSTLIGEAVDSALFYPLAFWGTWTPDVVVAVMLSNYAIKLGVEVLMTPATYWIVAKLKAAEQEDFYDRDTNFSPFQV